MRILIAPDKFKGSLTAAEVADNIAAGIREVLPQSEITCVPMADGGEGTAETICRARQGSWIRCKAHDPLGRVVDCRFAAIGHSAVFDMSEVSGLQRLAEDERDPSRATTFGVGELLLHARRHGATEVIIGLGGSATNDGGFGMARALGFRFFDHSENQLRSAVGKLADLSRIEKPAAIELPSIIAAVDVQNPLLGPIGATQTFARQKGAAEAQVDVLERALMRLAEVAARTFGVDHRDDIGAGAAGGLGWGLMTFARARVRAGFDVVAESVELEEKISRVDVVITGEGKLDAQTSFGKTPSGVAGLARKLGKPVSAIVGQAVPDPKAGQMFDQVVELKQEGIPSSECMARAAELLRVRARDLAERLVQAEHKRASGNC